LYTSSFLFGFYWDSVFKQLAVIITNENMIGKGAGCLIAFDTTIVALKSETATCLNYWDGKDPTITCRSSCGAIARINAAPLLKLE
jgi:hypothetical protein